MFRLPVSLALALALVAASNSQAVAAEPSLTLTRALQRALAANPRLSAADRDIGIAVGRRIQAGAVPNPEVGLEYDNFGGSGAYAGSKSAESTVQLGQLVELGGKRQARIAVGVAEVESATWQRAALRLEVMSEAALAFLNILGSQRRIQIYTAQIEALERLAPLLQRRVDVGAASPAEIARNQVATDLLKADREHEKTALGIFRRELAALIGLNYPDFGQAVGNLQTYGRLPPFKTIVASLDSNPQIVRWTAVRAQRDAELLAARLKPIPDVRVSAGWRHYRDTGDSAMRVGVAIPIPVWDQNRGGIIEASEARAKVESELAAARVALILTLGRAYETAVGSANEIDVLRSSAIPNGRRAVEAIENGFSQGRYSLLEVLDAQNTLLQANLREAEALIGYHTSVAIIEALSAVPLGVMRRERSRP